MCILIAKPAGVKAPSIKTMENCWGNNPDGAGIAYSDGRKLYLKKGFMEWDEFKKAYEKLSLDDHSAIIHFRIATHGTVKPENTHPFNVNDRMVAAHNGVLSGIENEGDMTDSETFFKRICDPILSVHDIESEFFSKVIAATIGTSKLAFLGDDGRLVKFGNFVESDGVFYSNSTYSYAAYPRGGYYGYNGYGRYDSNYGLYNNSAKKQYGNPYSKKAEKIPDASEWMRYYGKKAEKMPDVCCVSPEIKNELAEIGLWDLLVDDLEIAGRPLDITWAELHKMVTSTLNDCGSYTHLSGLKYKDVRDAFVEFLNKEGITVNKMKAW